MKKIIAGVCMVVAMTMAERSLASDFEKIPSAWKWLNNREVIFSFDGTYTDSTAFVYNVANSKRIEGVKAPEKYAEFPIQPDGAVNLTYSPDSSKLAFTRENDLYVVDIASGKERRLTYDGNQLILNGYSSWVYYEEILGRPSKYRAFWWSDDSKKLGFYHFDNTQVPLFPIYSPFGQDGSLNETRYPKAGERNPQVKIGMIDVEAAEALSSEQEPEIVWADFDPSLDQYFGIPFWDADSKYFYIARMPRLQNTLELYKVSCLDGSKEIIYTEKVDTWLNWIDEVIFTEKGLYMARDFESGWEQIYFLSYDGKDFRRLTDGQNWRISLLRVDQSKGDVYFTAERDSRVASSLYKLDAKGHITALTEPGLHVEKVAFSQDCKHFVASLSGFDTPSAIYVARSKDGKRVKVADMAPKDFNREDYALPQLITMTYDGLEHYGAIVYPKNFDPAKKYPVHVDIYGGPDTPVVTGKWKNPKSFNWWSDNDIIQVWADCRAAGHNGRKGLDGIYRQLTVLEVEDFVAWADYLKTLPFVDGQHIGVEGFSFGGTMTSMLVIRHPDKFSCGVAGGGVYDWKLYDSHYTERYMDTPQANPQGYEVSAVLTYVEQYKNKYGVEPSGNLPMLKLTHGTGDDNVHFQNTLQLIDSLHKIGARFDFMIYPDGMHGYHGYQGEHFRNANREFWLKYLLDREL